MGKKDIEKSLKRVLIGGEPFEQALYEFELQEHQEEYLQSKHQDGDRYFVAITAHSGDVAMLLIDQNDQVLVNEEARNTLKKLWLGAVYESNMRLLIPAIASVLDSGELFAMGVKVAGE